MTIQTSSSYATSSLVADDDLAAYLVSVADKLQSRVDEVGTNMSKKLEEMTKRINTLEKSLKQTEPQVTAAAVAATAENDLQHSS